MGRERRSGAPPVLRLLLLAAAAATPRLQAHADGRPATRGHPGAQCRCRACAVHPANATWALSFAGGDDDDPNTASLLQASNLSDLPRGHSGIHLAAHRGTASNKKSKRQRPLFLFMCERRPLPGYPHSMAPPRDLRTPKVTATNPSGLSYGVLFRSATPARLAMRKRCLRTRNDSVAIFLGDSITFGALVQSRMQWPLTVDLDNEGTPLPNASFPALSVFWRVAIQALEGRIASKHNDAAGHGVWWHRRAYPVGRGGITAGEFNDDYTESVLRYLRGTRAGKVTFVTYFLGTNDMLLAGMGNSTAVQGFRKAARRMLGLVRRHFDGPLVLGTVPFGTDPGKTHVEWLQRKVWWNWAVDDINDEIRALAREFYAGIADFHWTMAQWRKNLPQLDGVHPAWWAHKALAQELLKGMTQAVSVLPASSSALGSGPDCTD